jgi:hypothetical protein
MNAVAIGLPSVPRLGPNGDGDRNPQRSGLLEDPLVFLRPTALGGWPSSRVAHGGEAASVFRPGNASNLVRGFSCSLRLRLWLSATFRRHRRRRPTASFGTRRRGRSRPTGLMSAMPAPNEATASQRELVTACCSCRPRGRPVAGGITCDYRRLRLCIGERKPDSVAIRWRAAGLEHPRQ